MAMPAKTEWSRPKSMNSQIVHINHTREDDTHWAYIYIYIYIYMPTPLVSEEKSADPYASSLRTGIAVRLMHRFTTWSTQSLHRL